MIIATTIQMAAETERLVLVLVEMDVVMTVVLGLVLMAWEMLVGLQVALALTTTTHALVLITRGIVLEHMVRLVLGLQVALELTIQLIAEMKQGALGQLLST